MLKLLLSSVVLSLVGCETMEPSGSLFQPATDATVADLGGVADESAPQSDFPAEVSFSISSEELAGGDEGAPAAPSTEATEAPGQDEPGTETSQPEESLSDAEPPQFTANTQAMNPTTLPVATATTSGWPVRVVSTVPGAQPPRAILGLPGGQELVVAPGSMVAEQNLVILAVGTRTVEVAHIQAVGDHANVIPMTLTAQFGP